MNGSHSGNGTVKSEARKISLKTYRDRGRREANRDRRMARIAKRFRPHINGMNVSDFRRAQRRHPAMRSDAA